MKPFGTLPNSGSQEKVYTSNPLSQAMKPFGTLPNSGSQERNIYSQFFNTEYKRLAKINLHIIKSSLF